MRFLILILAITLSPILALAQSGDYEVIQVDVHGGTFTGEANKLLRTFRVRPGVEVTINGVKGTFAGLEVGMKVQVTSAEPGVATRLVANGLQTQKPLASGKPLISPGLPPAREESAVIPANSADGFLMENLRKGTKISLQYKKGAWKSWGNLGTENPDDKKSERGDVCRLTIALPSRGDKPGKVLAVIPPETGKRPFVYVVPLDFPALVLRINDPDGSFAKNPGKVEYDIKIFPPTK
jgi:hypothetical protein